ncbi:MAG: type IVB secretion system protein IcmH/DotU [Gammaproteobacteria bacterium]|nr:type IVB secretion system protein IcmH/DotU [Gammaproteobacteria bacterium]
MQTEPMLTISDQEENTAVALAALPSVAKSAVAIQTYCPSKTFIARSGVNPLVACASALFSLIAKLRHTEDYADISQLRADLIHEIKAFECAAVGRHYNAEQIVMARYVICATLDECIVQTQWGRAGDWHRLSLVNAFEEDETTGERVFALLDRLRSKIKHSIDLIEFFYLCLSLGFEGKYRFIDNGHQSLDLLLDELYRLIRSERGDLRGALTLVKSNSVTPLTKKTFEFPLKRLLIGTGSILAVIYLSFVMMLHIEIQPVYQLLSAMTLGTAS